MFYHTVCYVNLEDLLHNCPQIDCAWYELDMPYERYSGDMILVESHNFRQVLRQHLLKHDPAWLENPEWAILEERFKAMDRIPNKVYINVC